MVFAENDFIEDVLHRVSSDPVVVPGGSACNTIVGLGSLGNPARFIGKCGRDAPGNLIHKDLVRSGVEPVLFTSSSPTGKVLSVITPDAQRTMFTFLGAASEIDPGEITVNCFRRAAVAHIEGYMLYNRDLMLAILSNAKSAGARISLDLASFTIVKEAREFLHRIVRDYVDILIANEDEARAFTGHSDEAAAIRSLGQRAPLAVLKVGKRGSYIAYGEGVVQVAPVPIDKAVDTTGAGDLWASGFLYGLVNGHPLESCGWLGSVCGSEVCQVVGAAIPETGWRRIRGHLEELHEKAV